MKNCLARSSHAQSPLIVCDLFGGAARRHALVQAFALAAAVAATPAFEPALLDRATRRAAGLERLHALIVARHGRIVFAEAFGGPPLDRPVNVKSVSKTLVASLAGAAIDRGLLARR